MLAGLDERHPGLRGQEVAVAVLEEVEGERLSLELARRLRTRISRDQAVSSRMWALVGSSMSGNVDVGRGPVSSSGMVIASRCLKDQAPSSSEERQAIICRLARRRSAGSGSGHARRRGGSGRLLPFRPGRLRAHLLEPAENGLFEVLVIGLDPVRTAARPPSSP